MLLPGNIYKSNSSSILFLRFLWKTLYFYHIRTPNCKKIRTSPSQTSPGSSKKIWKNWSSQVLRGIRPRQRSGPPRPRRAEGRARGRQSAGGAVVAELVGRQCGFLGGGPRGVTQRSDPGVDEIRIDELHLWGVFDSFLDCDLFWSGYKLRLSKHELSRGLEWAELCP